MLFKLYVRKCDKLDNLIALLICEGSYMKGLGKYDREGVKNKN
jgi:hypothetical protein